MKKNNPTNPNPSPRRFVRLRCDELYRPEALPGAVVHREVDEPVSNYFKMWDLVLGNWWKFGLSVNRLI